MVQGGSLGIFGYYLFGEPNRFGNTALESAAGLALGTAPDLINLWAKAGDDTTPSALRLAQNNTPFMNLFLEHRKLTVSTTDSVKTYSTGGPNFPIPFFDSCRTLTSRPFWSSRTEQPKR
ncbi:hypothetical protein NP552_10430 [Pseudomonas sp. 8209]|nr:hypothetical protein [Pseudomonas sp. 8209]